MFIVSLFFFKFFSLISQSNVCFNFISFFFLGMRKGVGCQRRPEPCVLSEFGKYDSKCPVACDGDYRRRHRTILKPPSVAPIEDGSAYNGESCAVVNCKMNRAAFVDRTNINLEPATEATGTFQKLKKLKM